MKINTNTKRHGRCAAVALMAEVDADAFLSKLDAYLAGYAAATPSARAGFLDILSDTLSEGYRGINTKKAAFYCSPEFHGRTKPPTRAEWQAHGHAWVEAAAATSASTKTSN